MFELMTYTIGLRVARLMLMSRYETSGDMNHLLAELKKMVYAYYSDEGCIIFKKDFMDAMMNTLCDFQCEKRSDIAESKEYHYLCNCREVQQWKLSPEETCVGINMRTIHTIDESPYVSWYDLITSCRLLWYCFTFLLEIKLLQSFFHVNEALAEYDVELYFAFKSLEHNNIIVIVNTKKVV
ncbi:hypothetical protein RFI_10945, partial [Reticulomyxa filosa]